MSLSNVVRFIFQVRLFTPTGSLTFKRHIPKYVTHKLGAASLGGAVAPMPGVVEKVRDVRKTTFTQILRQHFTIRKTLNF